MRADSRSSNLLIVLCTAYSTDLLAVCCYRCFRLVVCFDYSKVASKTNFLWNLYICLRYFPRIPKHCASIFPNENARNSSNWPTLNSVVFQLWQRPRISTWTVRRKNWFLKRTMNEWRKKIWLITNSILIRCQLVDVHCCGQSKNPSSKYMGIFSKHTCVSDRCAADLGVNHISHRIFRSLFLFRVRW